MFEVFKYENVYKYFESSRALKVQRRHRQAESQARFMKDNEHLASHASLNLSHLASHARSSKLGTIRLTLQGPKPYIYIKPCRVRYTYTYNKPCPVVPGQIKYTYIKPYQIK